jgi:hypothetical protein
MDFAGALVECSSGILDLYRPRLVAGAPFMIAAPERDRAAACLSSDNAGPSLAASSRSTSCSAPRQ